MSTRRFPNPISTKDKGSNFTEHIHSFLHVATDILRSL